MLLQAELQQQLADCTSTNWEGFHIMQLKIQALVSWLCTLPQLLWQSELASGFDPQGAAETQDALQHLSPLTSVQVLDLIHSLEVVNNLMADGARQLTDWAWSKQLRYYSAGLVLGDCG